MITYDDKSKGAVSVGNTNNSFIINNIEDCGEIVFKASYIIAADLIVSGKIIALFDLIVLGNVKAYNIEVKGKFVCLGNCDVEESIIVNGKIIAQGIKAKNVESHEQVISQEIDVKTIKVEGNILVGQTLAIEDLAYSEQNILCGETAYGAGRISASCITTVEELDLDRGIDAVVNPNKINFDKNNSLGGFDFGRQYIAKNNFNDYLKELNGTNDRQLLNSLKRWQSTLNKTAELFKDKEPKNLDCYDLGLLLTLTEISQSIYFKGWTKIQDWNSRVQSHFDKLMSANSSDIDIPMSITDFKIGKRVIHKNFGPGKIVSINNLRVKVLFDTGAEREFGLTVGRKFFSVEREKTGNISEINERLYINPMGYGEWIAFISILKLYGSLYNEKLVEIIEDLLYSKVGLKTKFVKEIIRNNGRSKDE